MSPDDLRLRLIADLDRSPELRDALSAACGIKTEEIRAAVDEAYEALVPEAAPCTFRGICNMGRAMRVQVGNPGAKPCSGPRKTYLWNGKPDDHTYTVCAEHEGEFRYWYRNAKEAP